jgi:hypothetical protein
LGKPPPRDIMPGMAIKGVSALRSGGEGGNVNQGAECNRSTVFKCKPDGGGNSGAGGLREESIVVDGAGTRRCEAAGDDVAAACAHACKG